MTRENCIYRNQSQNMNRWVLDEVDAWRQADPLKIGQIHHSPCQCQGVCQCLGMRVRRRHWGFQWVSGDLPEPVQVHYGERCISQCSRGVFSVCFMFLVLEARLHTCLIPSLLLCNIIHIAISMHTCVSIKPGVSKHQTWSRGPYRLAPSRNHGVRVVSVVAFRVLCLKTNGEFIQSRIIWEW